MIAKSTIIKFVAKEINISTEELLGRSRLHDINKGRVIAWQVFREDGYSYPAIARFFKRDHSTVMTLLKGGDPVLKAKGKELYQKLINSKDVSEYELYPELFEVKIVKVPDYKENKIITIQQFIKKM